MKFSVIPRTSAILGNFDMQYLPRETSSKDGSPDRMPHQGLVQLRRVGQEVSQVVVAQGAKGLLRRHEDGPRPRVRHQDAEERGGAECSQGFPKLSAKREVIHMREHRVTFQGSRSTSDGRGKTTCTNCHSRRLHVIRHLICLLGNALLQGMRKWLVANVVHTVHQVHKKCHM